MVLLPTRDSLLGKTVTAYGSTLPSRTHHGNHCTHGFRLTLDLHSCPDCFFRLPVLLLGGLHPAAHEQSVHVVRLAFQDRRELRGEEGEGEGRQEKGRKRGVMDR